MEVVWGLFSTAFTFPRYSPYLLWASFLSAKDFLEEFSPGWEFRGLKILKARRMYVHRRPINRGRGWNCSNVVFKGTCHPFPAYEMSTKAVVSLTEPKASHMIKLFEDWSKCILSPMSSPAIDVPCPAWGGKVIRQILRKHRGQTLRLISSVPWTFPC